MFDLVLLNQNSCIASRFDSGEGKGRCISLVASKNIDHGYIFW